MAEAFDERLFELVDEFTTLYAALLHALQLLPLPYHLPQPRDVEMDELREAVHVAAAKVGDLPIDEFAGMALQQALTFWIGASGLIDLVTVAKEPALLAAAHLMIVQGVLNVHLAIQELAEPME